MPESNYVRDVVLSSLHIALALFLLLITLLEHGPPILTADEAAALGFLTFFVVGPPVLAIAVGTIVVSVYAGKWWLNVLAASLLVGFFLAVINLWTGILASLSYFSFAIWALVRRRSIEGAGNRGADDSRIGVRWGQRALLFLAVLIAAGLFAALFVARE